MIPHQNKFRKIFVKKDTVLRCLRLSKR